MKRMTLAIVAVGAVTAATAAASAGNAPMPWTLPPITRPEVKDRADRLYRATQHLARFLLPSVHPWKEDPALRLATESRSGEHHVRPNTGIVCGLSFLYRFGDYDEGVVGIPRERLLRETILPMIRYLTQTHVTGKRPTGDGKPWGDAWQSAHWANALGRGAWFLGEDLPGEVAADVRRVVAHEADRIAGMEPPHQVKADTKAEENAWNSGVISMAIVLMPEDPRREAWERAFHKWALSSFLRPADERSSALVDGRPISELFTGANIYDDFTLENHHFVHPDYMTTFSLLLESGVNHLLTGRRVPQVLLHNLPGIYENLKWFTLPDGGFVYPSGQDWALFRNPDWLYPHILMAVFARDAEAWTLAGRSLVVLEKMQARTTSGRTFLSEENSFASAEADKLYMFGKAWLALHFMDEIRGVEPVRAGVRLLESGKIILNRTPTAIHTVNWGAKVMAQCVPFRRDRMVSPHTRSGIGSIRLAGDTNELPIALKDARVVPAERGFTADLVVHHGDAVRAELRYESKGDGTWTVREKLTALRDVSIADVTTGLVGILNNRDWVYERGERHVELGAQTVTVPAWSGKRLAAEGITLVRIDDVLTIRSEKPLSVRYQAATQPDRGRATDELTLNTHAARAYRAGETISEWQAVMQSARD